MTNPQDALKEPKAEDPLPGAVSFFVGGNFISPSYYITWVLKHTIDFDPFEWVARQVAGDWEAVEKAADAATNLGVFNDDFAKSIKSDWANSAQNSWKGHAGDGANSYFQGLSGAVEWQVGPLQEIGHELSNIASSMRNLGRALADILQDLSDLALLWAATEISAAYAGPAGEAFGAAVSAAYVIEMIAKRAELFEKVETVYKAITGIVAVLEGLTSHTSADKLPELPNAYQ